MNKTMFIAERLTVEEKPLLSRLEDTIFEMVIDERSLGFIVKRKNIKEFATTLTVNEGYIYSI